MKLLGHLVVMLVSMATTVAFGIGVWKALVLLGADNETGGALGAASAGLATVFGCIMAIEVAGAREASR
jgi:hypothetical protein